MKFHVVKIRWERTDEVSVSKGILNPEDFPLRMHASIQAERKPACIVWGSFRLMD
jgi:hypothetical protein